MKKINLSLTFVLLLLIDCNTNNYNQIQTQTDANKQQKQKNTTDEATINSINELFNIINSKKLHQETQIIEQGEGAQYTVYHNNGVMEKFVAEQSYSLGSRIVEYYFNEGKLFFIYDVIYTPNPETLSINDIIKIENRFYFKNEKIIKWLDNEKKEVSKTEFSVREKEISYEFEIYAPIFPNYFQKK